MASDMATGYVYAYCVHQAICLLASSDLWLQLWLLGCACAYWLSLGHFSLIILTILMIPVWPWDWGRVGCGGGRDHSTWRYVASMAAEHCRWVVWHDVANAGMAA